MPVYEGGCHCGSVRISVDRAEAIDSYVDCDCSICAKKGVLHAGIEENDLTVVQGRDALENYQFHTKVAEHHFCRTCGIHVYSRPRNNPQRLSVNIRCLDDFHAIYAAARRIPFDGQNHPKDNV